MESHQPDPQDPQDPQDTQGTQGTQGTRVTSVRDYMKNEMMTTLNNFINELELVYEEPINKETFINIRELLNDIESDPTAMDLFINDTTEQLKRYENEISYISYTNKKVQKEKFQFMENIKLFNKLLNFQMFIKENKNTKITIVKYLHTVYMCCMFLSNKNENIDEISNELNTFLSNLKSSIQKDTHNSASAKCTSKSRKNNNTRPGNSPDAMLQSLLSNPQLMSIATDISKDMREKNINPLNMLSSLMSGKPDKEITSLVEKVNKTLEEKMDKGELNKDELQNQASMLLSSTSSVADLMKMIGKSKR